MRRLLIVVVALALTAAGCGDSGEEKAQKEVCDARADIGKQVDDLKALTPATFTTDAVTSSLDAIRSDLSKMKDAQGQLSDDRRQQVEDANQAFGDQVTNVIKDVGTSVSASDAASQVTQALQQLGSAYETAFSKLDCS